jgi:hypothetical protein
MKFIQLFFISALTAYICYFSVVLMLIDAPVPAEYWVGEMLVIKKELVKRFAGKNKVIFAGGSSTLFGIDAEYASEKLGLPVINFGLHAGLGPKKILKEVSTIVESGDVLILAFEPPHYGCNEKLTAWQVNNIIGWDHNAWRNMSYLEKIDFVSSVSFATFTSMIDADFQKRYYPSEVSERLATLDRATVLSRFRSRNRPTSFGYSAYLLDDFGDMQRTEGSKYFGKVVDIRKPAHICGDTKNYLIAFVNTMKKRGVRVYFANTPYIASETNIDKLQQSELGFLGELASIGCMIDHRRDLIFDRKYFFDTSYHLNTEGRRLRTNLIIKAIHNNVLSGTCLNAHSLQLNLRC